jgi:UrcA family protein
MFRTMLAAALIAGAASSSAIAQDITVTGPGERVVDRTDYNADIMEYTASVAVDVRKLDLSSAAGWTAMEERLSAASRIACDAVEQRIPIDLRPDRADCTRTAYRGAIARVRKLTRPPSS